MDSEDRLFIAGKLFSIYENDLFYFNKIQFLHSILVLDTWFRWRYLPLKMCQQMVPQCDEMRFIITDEQRSRPCFVIMRVTSDTRALRSCKIHINARKRPNDLAKKDRHDWVFLSMGEPLTFYFDAALFEVKGSQQSARPSRSTTYATRILTIHQPTTNSCFTRSNTRDNVRMTRRKPRKSLWVFNFIHSILPNNFKYEMNFYRLEWHYEFERIQQKSLKQWKICRIFCSPQIYGSVFNPYQLFQWKQIQPKVLIDFIEKKIIMQQSWSKIWRTFVCQKIVDDGQENGMENTYRKERTGCRMKKSLIRCEIRIKRDRGWSDWRRRQGDWEFLSLEDCLVHTAIGNAALSHRSRMSFTLAFSFSIHSLLYWACMR